MLRVNDNTEAYAIKFNQHKKCFYFLYVYHEVNFEEYGVP